jgi:alpha-ketoglutarate-dependent 2,4-dichlorophenoxyacetate dioxygenase
MHPTYFHRFEWRGGHENSAVNWHHELAVRNDPADLPPGKMWALFLCRCAQDFPPQGMQEGKAQAMEIRQLHPRFVGEITGLDTGGALDAVTVAAVEDVMAEYAVCVIRNATLGDDAHIRFSRAFGPLELPPGGRGRIASEIYDVGNLDGEGEIIQPNPNGPQPTDFELFHTDSPCNTLPTKWSLLLAYETPPEGANTDYIDMRAVYDDLPQETKSRIEGLEAEHDLFYALKRNGVAMKDDMLGKLYPRTPNPLVRTSANGRKSLYLGWHAVNIVGWDEAEGRKLLDELYAFSTQDKYIYSHKWQPGDMAIWDNRCTMHSATPFERYKYRRDMRRTTINESGPEVSAITPAAA